MKRGEVWDADLNPVEGSEQAGVRPVVIVSRNAINDSSPVVVAVPCTTFRPGRRIYPTHVLLQAPEGGLTADSVVRCEQIRALATSRFLRQRGRLSSQSIARLDRALRNTLDLA